MNLVKRYIQTSLVLRIIAGFILGGLAGIALWILSGTMGEEFMLNITSTVAPFGTVFVKMLKMIVIPVIFFSLVVGSSSLPIKKFGRVGVKVLIWYFACSALAAGVGIAGALIVNAGAGSDMNSWQNMVKVLGTNTQELAQGATTSGRAFSAIILNMFRNPFQSLAEGDFLPVIVFAILLGIAFRVLIENNEKGPRTERIRRVLDMFEALRDGVFKIVEWVLEYSPVGVFFLTVVNFALYGPQIVGTYVRVVIGVVGGVIFMILVVYPLLLAIATRSNPYTAMKKMQEAMIMAFATRSSAATLPVTISVAEKQLGIREELAAFALPLGATINMDGVCVHLPMFAVLAANMFGIDISAGDLIILMFTTILASIGTGGVPGGSTMLLFIILGAMGLDPSQVSIVVALALGINPVLDMFETMNNITGDLVCTYAVAKIENMTN